MGTAAVETGLPEAAGNSAEGRIQAGNGFRSRTEMRNLSDDEILGLGDRTRTSKRDPQDVWATNDEGTASAADPLRDQAEEPSYQAERTEQNHDDAFDKMGAENLQEIFDANPELKQLWDEAHAYREAFATPDEARAATKMLADLRTVDALFFSTRPNDHVELARLVATLDPAAFESLARAMSVVAMSGGKPEEKRRSDERRLTPSGDAGKDETKAVPSEGATGPAKLAQEQFLHAANGDAVRSVVQAIEGQVDRILPESVSKGARNRVVGEIYRELDAALQSNPQFSKQVRGAIRSGGLDSSHHSAIVSLIVGRAKQTLPSVAKRVLNEWTSTVLATDRGRREKRDVAESRVDISGTRGGGGEGSRVRSPRDIDYGRMSDADILNL